MADKLTTFYLIHGDNTVEIEALVKQLRARMADGDNSGLNISEMDGEQVNVPEVINAVSSFPFLSDRRMVIVKGLISRLQGRGKANKEALERLTDALPQLPDYARLVLVERTVLNERLPIVKLAQSHERGYHALFKMPDDATGWIMQRAKQHYNIAITPQAANALAQVTDNDIQLADNELVKLVSYLDGAGEITEEHVALLTPYVPEANIFAMVDAIASGDGATAFRLMHRLLDNPREQGFGLLGMIVRQFRYLLLTREYLENGGTTDPLAVADAIGLRGSTGSCRFQGKKYLQLSRRFSFEDLEKIYYRLHEIDMGMKSGKYPSPTLALDMLVAGLTRRRG